MEYKIIDSSKLTDKTEQKIIEELEEIINQMIEEGWHPLGGISVRVGSQRGAYFIQAMIRDK